MAQRGRTKGVSGQHWRTVTPSAVVLLYGSEEYFVSRARAGLRARYRVQRAEAEVVSLDAASYTGGELAMQASPSLFGAAKIIEVDNLASMSDDFLSDTLAYLQHPDPEVMLVMHHAGGNRGKKLVDAVRAQFTLVECKPLKTDRDRTGFVTGEVKAAGRQITPGALVMLAAAASDTAELAAACAQLVADIPGSITEDAVRRYYGGRTEVTAFRVADAAVSGNVPRALALLRHSLATGTDPIPLLGALALRMRTIARVHGVRASGADVAREVGVAPWQAEQALRDARRFSARQLGGIMRALADADAQLKGESQDSVYAIERAVLAIAAPRGGGTGRR